MDALLIGTGGADGWPAQGCHCASCRRARAQGVARRRTEVLVDGLLTLGTGTGIVPPAASGNMSHEVQAVTGGFDVTGPDGSRLLVASGPGAETAPGPEVTRPYDLAALDLLASPAQLGRLRARGLLRPGAVVVSLCVDHRVTSEAEMARRCALWGAVPGHDGQLITAGSGTTSGAAGPARPHRTLVLGGARSGKSAEAQLRLAAEPAVTYLAAGPWASQSLAGADGEPDQEWAQRVAAHQASRPRWWRTLESLDIAGALRRETGALLIDGIGTWLAAVMDDSGIWAGTQKADGVLAARVEELIDAWRETSALVVAVTDQVGSGLVPPYPAGRRFRDELGWLNQRLAAESDQTLLVVAGRVLELPA